MSNRIKWKKKKEKIYKMLPARLRFLRKEQKLTQDQLSKRLGISRARYSHYENGIHEPSTDVLQKIADYYNTSVEYILGRTDERERTTQPNKEEQNSDSPDLNKILRETTPHWNGKPLTSEQADALIAFYEALIKQNTKKKGES